MSNVDFPVPSAPTVRPRSSSSKRYFIVGAIVLAALGFLLFRGLGNATMYFRTADEAIAQRAELGDSRFRIEGTVVPGSIVAEQQYTNFLIASRDVKVQVRNLGQPLGIFQENIPVVLEGRFAGNSNVFESDRILVKHTSDYEAKYPDRVSGAANS